MIATPKEVLDFWFPKGFDADQASADAQIRWWFRGGEEVDRAVREKFAETHAAAVRGELDRWADAPRERLALILVLDQFSRNLERDKPEAFANDAKVARLAAEAFERGMVKDLDAWELIFMLVPLGHVEDMAMQELAMRWAPEMIARAPKGLEGTFALAARSTKAHRDEIARFGRHPGRNAVLGRKSTPEEIEYLEKTGPANAPRKSDGA